MNISPHTIPQSFKKIIGDEPIDFLIKAKRHNPLSKSLSLLGVSIFWTFFVCLFITIILKDQSLTWVESFNQLKEGKNTESLLLPLAFLCFFLFIGFALFLWGISSLFEKGGYFAGTPTRLIQFRKGKATIRDWEQFSGNIDLTDKGEYGSLVLQLRTGKRSNRKGKGEVFVPDTIHITKIKNVLDIERKCRIRIKENDPTPAQSSSNF